LRKLAVSNLSNAKTHYYDRKIKTQKYKIEDFVYLLKGKKKYKFDDEYIRSYEIVEILENI